ncbi:MAG: hypothetical protein ACLTSX_06490 [Collinsella sp.]
MFWGACDDQQLILTSRRPAALAGLITPTVSSVVKKYIWDHFVSAWISWRVRPRRLVIDWRVDRSTAHFEICRDQFATAWLKLTCGLQDRERRRNSLTDDTDERLNFIHFTRTAA